MTLFTRDRDCSEIRGDFQREHKLNTTHRAAGLQCCPLKLHFPSLHTCDKNILLLTHCTDPLSLKPPLGPISTMASMSFILWKSCLLDTPSWSHYTESMQGSSETSIKGVINERARDIKKGKETKCSIQQIMCSSSRPDVLRPGLLIWIHMWQNYCSCSFHRGGQ